MLKCGRNSYVERFSAGMRRITLLGADALAAWCGRRLGASIGVRRDEVAKRLMEATDVLELLGWLAQANVIPWIDGGWAVDAVLGYQTRPHGDLDLVIEAKHVPKVRAVLEAHGFTDQLRADTADWNFVLGDEARRDVDLHVISMDENGDGIYGPLERGVCFPAASLTGRGQIAGYAVRCISAEWLVAFHTGYAFDEDDVRDVLALHERFGIPLPQEYRDWGGRAARAPRGED